MADHNKGEDIILKIDVDYETAISSIAKYQSKVDGLKESQRDLKKELKDEKITRDDYNKAMAASKAEVKANQDAIRLLNKEIQNNIKEENAHTGSLVQLRAQLSNLTAQYDRLSEVERKSAKGQELQAHINEITDSLSEAEEETQRFYRNVGNYEESVIQAAAGNNKFAQSLLQASTSGKGMGGMLDMVKGQVKALFAVIIANPVIAVIAAIVIVFMAFKKVIDSSEESTAKLNKILAPLKMLLDFLLNILQKLVGVMLDGILAIGEFYTGMLKLAELLPIVGGLFKDINEEIEKSIELEQRKADLEKRTRAVQEQNAKHSRDVAKLRADAEDKLNHTAEDRLKFIRKANELEQESADNSLAIAKEKLAIAEEEASRTENKKEKEQELSNLRAEVYKAEETHFNKIRELQGKENAILTEIANADKARLDKINENAKKYADKQKEIREKELTATIEIQNLKYESEIKHLKNISDNQEKSHEERINALYKSNATEIEAVKYNEAQELKQKDLTTAQKELIQLKANQRLLDLQKELSDSTLQMMKDDEVRQLEAFNTNLENKVATIKKGSFEELNFRLQQLTLQEQAEIASAKKSGADIALIREKYRQLEIQEQEKQESYLASQKQKEFQNRILEAQLEGQNTLAIQLEQKTAELAAINQLEGESDIDYYNRKLEIQNALKGIEDDYLSYQLETRIQVMQATATIAGGFQELFESMAEDNATFAGFAKAMALFQIGIDTATALTKGIAQAQSVPFPANIAAIATTVATVLSNIAKAKKFLTAEKEPKAPKFNQGGLVSGSGSGTSDSIRAYLSNGESVMTARTTSMFSPILSAFNQIGGGVPISTQDASSQVMGEEMLSRAFSKAVSTLPKPVVSVQEIDNVNNRIEVLESSRTI